jgi:hypothetical protein
MALSAEVAVLAHWKVELVGVVDIAILWWAKVSDQDSPVGQVVQGVTHQRCVLQCRVRNERVDLAQ